MIFIFKILLAMLVLSPCSLTAQEEKPEEEKEKEDAPKEEILDGPPKVGNFSLPSSQQPSPLVGFGTNIIDAGEVVVYFFEDDFFGHRRTQIDVIPSVLFGVTDNFSIYFNFPFTPILRDRDNHSSGLEDFFVQTEYAFYSKKNYCYTDQATIVTALTVPTGSAHKIPPTGFGAPGFFIGGTFFREWVDWFAFTQHGATLPFSDHGTKFGNEFFYQGGFGRNFYTPCGWIYAWMLELDGQYFQKNRIDGCIDPNSGGNLIFATPSLWISSKELTFQLGVTFPLYQNLFGDQRKFDYGFYLSIGWSFY